MLLMVLFKVLFPLAVLYMATTQIIIPLWKGMPVFPILRNEPKLRRELASAKEETRDAKMEEIIRHEHERTERIKKRNI